MKQYLPFGIMLILLLACQNQVTEDQANNNKVEVSVAGDKHKSQLHQSLNKDSLWQDLVFQKGGCLVGGQYVKNGQFGKSPCVMTKQGWQHFFAQNEQDLTPFLLSKLADTTTTKIHTCPFFNATAGEVAVYGLQNLYKINWFDFEAFEHFQDREAEGETENHQVWLQHILQDEVQREQLKKCWKEKAAG